MSYFEIIKFVVLKRKQIFLGKQYVFQKKKNLSIYIFISPQIDHVVYKNKCDHQLNFNKMLFLTKIC